MESYNCYCFVPMLTKKAIKHTDLFIIEGREDREHNFGPSSELIIFSFSSALRLFIFYVAQVTADAI